MQKLENGAPIGSYTILRLVGRGGMGEVYEAHEGALGRRVAVKVISPQAGSRERELDLIPRFLNEARTLAQVNHPNIVTVHAIQRTSQHHFIAMEFVEGVSLRDVFKSCAFSAAEAAPIFLQTLEGVAALHDKLIVHRDLKPHNLMLRPDGQVKILDFGIACREGESLSVDDTNGRLEGTLAYMAPEIVHGVRADSRSDLWSLGAIFFEALVGRQLVTLYTERVTGVRAHPQSEVVFPEECLERVPEEFRRFIGRLCERNPGERYGSARQAAADLRQIMANLAQPPPELARVLIAHLNSMLSREPAKKPEEKRAVLSNLGFGEGSCLRFEDTRETTLERVRTDSLNERLRTRKKLGRGGRFITRKTAVLGAVVVVIVAGVSISKLLTSKGEEVHQNVIRRQVEVKAKPPIRPMEALPPQTFNAQFRGSAPTDWPTVTWPAVPDAAGYRIEFSRDSDFKVIFKSAIVKGTRFGMQKFVAGKFFWRVSVEGRGTPQYGATGVLTVNLPPPTLRETRLDAKSGLNWAPVPMADRYIVQWADNRALLKPFEKVTSRPRVLLPRGAVRFVRIAAADSNGKRVGEFSHVTRISSP